jgi:hypothetical protein
MADKYQDILSTLGRSSSFSESNERVTSPVLVYVQSLIVAKGTAGAFHIHNFNTGKGFQGGDDASFQRLASSSRRQIASHRQCDLKAAQRQSPASLWLPFGLPFPLTLRTQNR